jgi:hypothetical protein
MRWSNPRGRPGGRGTIWCIAVLGLATAGFSLPRPDPSRPFEPGRRVTLVDGEFFQGGRSVDRVALLFGLEQVDASRDRARSGIAWLHAFQPILLGGLGAVSGGLTYAAVTEEPAERRTALIVAGAGAVVASLSFTMLSVTERRLRQAVDVYNTSLPPGSADATSRLLPWVVAVPDGRSGWAPIAGVCSRF